jgi:mannonate dehydratase
LTLEAIENVPYAHYADVMRGGPNFQEQLDNLKKTVRNLGLAGVTTFGYNFMPTFVWRTTLNAQGRGGASVSGFDADLVRDGNMILGGGVAIGAPLTREQVWANYGRFLEELLPVAEDAGVRLALHPDDPPIGEICGSARIFASVDDLKRGYELGGHSVAWGLDLCLGTVSEMAGSTSVTEAIDYFGPLGRIFYVHFRDVQGVVPRFQECFIGEGNYDPALVMTRLVKSGFDGFILDDHVPAMTNDSLWGHRARAHAIGYLQGLLRAVSAARTDG